MTSDRDQPAVALDPGGLMPLVGLGTWQMTEARCQAAVRAALEVGYPHIDTATMYRTTSGTSGGRFVTAGSRAARCSSPPTAPGRGRPGAAHPRRQPPGPWHGLRGPVAGPLAAAGLGPGLDLGGAAGPRDQGLARAVGVSNYRLAQLDQLAAATGQVPQVNQIPWAPALYDPALLEGHRCRGVMLEGYSPFKNTDLRHPVLTEIAARHGVTPAQVVVRWHVDHQVVVIPKSAKPGRSPPTSTSGASALPARSWPASTGCRLPHAGSGSGPVPSDER